MYVCASTAMLCVAQRIYGSSGDVDGATHPGANPSRMPVLTPKKKSSFAMYPSARPSHRPTLSLSSAMMAGRNVKLPRQTRGGGCCSGARKGTALEKKCCGNARERQCILPAQRRPVPSRDGGDGVNNAALPSRLSL